VLGLVWIEVGACRLEVGRLALADRMDVKGMLTGGNGGEVELNEQPAQCTVSVALPTDLPLASFRVALAVPACAGEARATTTLNKNAARANLRPITILLIIVREGRRSSDHRHHVLFRNLRLLVARLRRHYEHETWLRLIDAAERSNS
jgi:hypothetical protein